MKKLAAFIFGLLISLSFYADARLVSGTAQHQHDSATGGGAAINNTSIGSNSKIAPSIFVYDKDAPLNEKYWKFGNASGDFVLFTYDDTQALGQTAFSITRTGTVIDKFAIPVNLELTGSVKSTVQGVFNSSGNTNPGLIATGFSLSQTGNVFEIYKDRDLGLRLFSVGFDGTVSTSKSCETGYTRVGPNFCHRNTPTWVSLSRDNCTMIGGASSGSQAILLRTIANARAVNIEGVRRSFIDSFTTNACTTILIPQLSDASAYEMPGVPASNSLDSDTSTTILRSPGGIGGQHYIRFADDAGDGGTAYYMFLGYYD